jgi:hypothetical protein
MLVNITKVIRGTVRVVNNSKDVIWVVDKRKNIIDLVKIFDKYPPLTSRLQCQLEFLKACLKENSVDLYLKNRNLKYSNQLNKIKLLELNNLIILNYFSS